MEKILRFFPRISVGDGGGPGVVSPRVLCYNGLDALLRKIPEELTMIALTLTNVKKFMSQLLRSEIFDNFWFIEGEIVTFNTFSINGAIHKSFFDSDTH